MEKREDIRQHYAEVAQSVISGEQGPDEGACCTPTSCCGSDELRLYPEDVKNGLPIAALKASRGCGNPLGEIDLQAGATVLDLGCGGGIDCLIAASEVGPAGKVYGLDMTDEMLALANENKRVAGAENVEFIKGFIEDIPLPDDTADVITSNCVINLSEDKAKALSEAYRVLAPGGVFLVADLLTLKPEYEGEAGLDLARLYGCRAGVLLEESYAAMMRDVGFEEVRIRVTSVCSAETARMRAWEKGVPEVLARYTNEELDGVLASAIIEGAKHASTAQR